MLKFMRSFPGGVLLLALAAFILPVSCTTVSPVTSALERGIPKAPSPESILPQWRPFAADTVRGLDYFAGKTARPRLEFRALRVDLAEPGLRLVVYDGEHAAPGKKLAAGAAAPQNGASIPSTWVSGFVRRYGLLAGINAGPFDPVSGREGEPRTNIGISVAGGVLVSPPVPQFDALVFYTGGGAAIRSQGDLGDLSAIQEAVGGFYQVLGEGRLTERTRLLAESPSNPRHPRSAAGISADGKFLYLLVIDGRRPGSVGATEAETGIILRQLGAAEGINLDGGGSTSLALRFPDGRVRPVNVPIHRGIPGRERGVASCLGIGAVSGAPAVEAAPETP
ncbi:MAG: phosphodiester glycosidase family protein [Treponema sp.]|nr:phosphodiester glycosidase family protein [Treponema sp.]